MLFSHMIPYLNCNQLGFGTLPNYAPRLWKAFSAAESERMHFIRSSQPHIPSVLSAPSPTCNCGLEDQTAEHILPRCPLLQTARTNVWPTAVQLHTKLYGSREGNWRRRPHSSCRLNSQCSGDREEEQEEKEKEEAEC